MFALSFLLPAALLLPSVLVAGQIKKCCFGASQYEYVSFVEKASTILLFTFAVYSTYGLTAFFIVVIVHWDQYGEK